MTDNHLDRRRFLQQAALSASAVAFGAGLASIGKVEEAFAASTLEKARKQGFIRIAIANEPPWTEVTAGGKVTGAAPEVARAVMKRLGVEEVLATVTEYGAMIPGLQAGRFDMVAAGLFIKPKRCAAVLFSEPDLCDAEAFLIKKGNPLGLETYQDIAKHGSAKVGAPGGGSEEQLALEAGVPRSRVVVVPDAQSGVKMLQNGRIDVYALPTLSLTDLKNKADDPNLELLTPVKGTPVFCAGAAFRKQDRSLRDAYDAELRKMKQSGEFRGIVSKFNFPADAPDLTSREQLCGGPN